MSDDDIREMEEEIDQYKKDRHRLAHIGAEKMKNFFGKEIEKCLITTEQSVEGVFGEVRQD